MGPGVTTTSEREDSWKTLSVPSKPRWSSQPTRTNTSLAEGGIVAAGYDNRFHDINGRKVQTVDGDGYCLFHAVAVGLGKSGEGMEVFNVVFAVLMNRKEELRDFVEGSVEEYLEKLKGGYGDELEIRYMKEIYNIEIAIWVQDSELGATTDVTYPVTEGAVHIAYRNGVH